ncbi:MAG: TMEM128 family protein [Bacteroidota bacterium]
MSDYKRQLEDLAEIRSLMEESSRFMSLSGLSGVGAGLVAIVGAVGTYLYLDREDIYGMLSKRSYVVRMDQLWTLVGIAILILVLAIAVATFFTLRNARRKEAQLWTKASRRLAWNLAIPLIAGAIFCVELALWGVGGMVAPATLIFYGMGLLNAGKYTLGEIRYLGMSQIGVGLVAAWFPGYGLICWMIGFGVLHILYGIVMYLRHER